ncbi:TetR/AcrR family transcriptional regulator [Bradyrhizobium sp. USDA 4369]
MRLQALLDAAEELIVEVGLQGLAMREVARRANLPIASVYHYFPSTTALVRALVERMLTDLTEVLQAGLQARIPLDAEAIDFDQLGALIDDVAAFFFDTPSVRELWAGLHAYPDLRALNIDDTKKNAALVAPHLASALPSLSMEQVTVVAIVLVEWVSSTLILATASPPKLRESLVEILKTLINHAIAGMSGQSPATPSKRARHPAKALRASARKRKG